jgi:D-glycero-D-manno-heptose 1,7-bisphosphate phosphatase
MPDRYLLLDRDGTLIVEKNYLSNPDEVEVIPGAAQALKRFQGDGWRIAVLTNQAGIGRGLYKVEDMERVHVRLRSLLSADGVIIDGFYACPHHPADDCRCRKPSPGLVEQAVADLGFDPAEAVIVGDKACDIELGRAVGAKTVLVRTGYGLIEETNPDLKPDFVIDSLADLTDCIELD